MKKQSKARAPVVTLTAGTLNGKRTLNLHLKEKWGRGKRAQVRVERLNTKEQAIDLLVERAKDWSDQDLRTIRGKAFKLMWNAPWPLNEKWLSGNGGDHRA
ncbi:hypothetical protein EHF33_15190 [Deinococcus psychrotolerans]|uniref:Uncharacterized protein n=1 Tax=Deinococcus psychrotolerans TaxID=2489213 RepID=A0A3G8YFX1_9DEIO|nr:hypothetical protein [Deinococcus psychrotolerans]AZI44239.1 hypothetical protein EHF33_15190 [Deinococcus psychrotolerans]